MAASTSSAAITRATRSSSSSVGSSGRSPKGRPAATRGGGAVSIEDYASHGAGLYKVIGSSTGPGACSGAVLVNVKGKSPLTTTAGMVGAALTGVGGLGLVASAIRSVPKGTRRPLALVGMLLLPVMMVGIGGSAAAPPTAAVDGDGRAGWRPRLSVLSLLSGVLAGVGAVILLQQYAVAYPTRGLALTGVVGGLVLGLLATNVPSLLVRGRAGRSPVVAEGLAEDSAAETREDSVAPVGEASMALAAETTMEDLEAAPAWAPTHAILRSRVSRPGRSRTTRQGSPSTSSTPGWRSDSSSRRERRPTVLCSNGWSAWVDSPQLVELSQ